MSEMTISEYAAGARCEIHEIPFCADCRERLGIRRGVARAGTGADDEKASDYRYRDDCGVASFRELTGASYDEAVEAIGSGFNPRTGTQPAALKSAIESVGYSVRQAGLGIVSARKTKTDGLTVPDARAASVGGRRSFLLIGADRHGAHAWTIVDGKVNRAFLAAPYRYGILEVIA
jgi:hypothetical protein